MKFMKKPELSIIILNYNTKELLEDCLNSVKKHMNEVPLEVIVSDNASNDGSPDMIRKKFPWVKLLEGENEGFSRGNNRARPHVKGEMVLFLNPDTIVHDNVFALTVRYLKEHKDLSFYIEFIKSLCIIYPILFIIGYAIAHFYTWILFNYTF